MTEFTPYYSALGGALIGAAAVLFMATNGRIAGISGIVTALLPPSESAGFRPRLAFVIGLVAAPVLYQLSTGEAVIQNVTSNVGLMSIAGLLVGFGAVLGSGCTSGHGVCGMARLSVRSIAATATFMAAAIATVYVTRHLIGV